MRPPIIAFAWQCDVVLGPRIGNMTMLGDCPDLSSSHSVSELLQFFRLFNEPANPFNRRAAENLSDHCPASTTNWMTVSPAIGNPPVQLETPADRNEHASARPSFLPALQSNYAPIQN